MRSTTIRARRRGTAALVALAAGLHLFMVAPLFAHDAPGHAPAGANDRIDPHTVYPFAVVAGGGGHFHVLQVMPGDERLFAGTHLGLFLSEDRGLTWRLAASRFSGVDVHAVGRDPRSSALYAATHGQGVLVSRDDGARWEDDSSGLAGRDVHALAIDPRDPRRLYVWSVAHGLFLRRGRGGAWERRAGPDALPDVESLAVSPADSRRLYAGTARGVWVSDDAGHHWRMPRGGLDRRTAGVAVVPQHPARLIAATLDGVFVGHADGTGWTPMEPVPSWWGPIVGFAFLDERPDTIFAVAHEGPVVMRPIDHGPWTPAASTPRQAAAPRRVAR